MKKLFIIFSCSITLSVFVFLICLNFVFINVGLIRHSPDQINIYNKSITAYYNTSYDSSYEEYNALLKKLSNSTRFSLFESLIKNISRDHNFVQDTTTEYASIADTKTSSLCIELVYGSSHDQIVYASGVEKVISYDKLLFVFPTNNSHDILVFFARNNNYYSSPVVLYGDSQNLVNYINSL